MGEESLLEITRKELGALKDFLETLKEERDAIISFSLEGVIRENSRKEALLTNLDELEKKKQEVLAHDKYDSCSAVDTEEMAVLRSEIFTTLAEVKTGLNKNMRLLSFSMDHVQSSIENIVRFLNKTAYGSTKRGRISLMLSKEI